MNQSRRTGRPRLDAGERDRLLAEIARLDGDAAPSPSTELRSAVLGPGAALVLQVVDLWGNLKSLPIDEAALERNLVIAATRRDPAHAAFDVLRTRLVQALRDNGWRRVAITSPTAGCGKTFTAANLAVALSRYEACRTVLLDLDLRAPSLAQVFGTPAPGPIGSWLRGHASSETQLRRVGQNLLRIGGGLAIGLNGGAESYPAELLQDPTTARVLDRMEAELEPDVVLYDLPPVLSHDDVIAFRDRFDCVLMVVGGGRTRADQVRESVRRLGEDKPLVGVVLNHAEDVVASGAA